MKIQRFYDESLAHASYALLAGKEIAVIDPSRNPQPYYGFAKEHDATIVAVVETHPHADFVSSHLEIYKATGATIFTSGKTNATYPHLDFDDGDQISLGRVTSKAKNTPGHSLDSICVVIEDEMGQDQAAFTGDTLFVGDVGRPDLREDADNFATKREEMARELYHSTRYVLMKLDPAVKIYPAHGPGSLCGKNISSDLSSTIGREIKENYALQPMSDNEFVDLILKDQPYIPKYFSYNVILNMKGADNFEKSVKAVPRLNKDTYLQKDTEVVDARPAEIFKKGHFPGAINIMGGGKFETWLGSVIEPEKEFYLVAESKEALEDLIVKCAKIGYEKNIKGALLTPESAKEQSPLINAAELKKNPLAFQIVDVRNSSELKEGKIFDQAIHVPLPELSVRAHELKTNKPIVVHCASGYRSAIGASILEKMLPGRKVYDLSGAVKDFK